QTTAMAAMRRALTTGRMMVSLKQACRPIVPQTRVNARAKSAVPARELGQAGTKPGLPVPLEFIIGRFPDELPPFARYTILRIRAQRHRAGVGCIAEFRSGLMSAKGMVRPYSSPASKRSWRTGIINQIRALLLGPTCEVISKCEIVKGITCPGLHRQRRCDIIARWGCRPARAPVHGGNIAA